jgi:hypothetical protein
MAKSRQQWLVQSLVFLDETGLNTKMARLDGRDRGGLRLEAAVPNGH